MNGYSIKQSTTAQPLVFLMVDSTDHITGKTLLSPTVTLSKNGGAFASPAGAVTEIGSGWYKVAGNATDSGTLGPLLLHATGTGADPVDAHFAVVAYDPQTVAVGANTVAPATPTNVSDVQTAVLAKLPAALVSGRIDASVGAMTTAAVASIWDALTSGITTASSIGKRLIDYLTGDIFTRLGAPAGASIAADIAAAKTVLDAVPSAAQNAVAIEAAILNEGDATALLAAIAAKVEAFLINEGDATATIAAIAAACNAAVAAGAVGTNAATAATQATAAAISASAAVTAIAGVQSDTDNIQTRLPAALSGGRMPAELDSAARVKLDASQPDYVPATAAQVNAEVLDVLNVDTFAEETGVPAATASLRKKIGWMFMWFRNKVTQTGTTSTLFADDGTTPVGTHTVSDDATTFTSGEGS